MTFDRGTSDIRRYSSKFTQALRQDGRGVTRIDESSSYDFVKGKSDTQAPRILESVVMPPAFVTVNSRIVRLPGARNQVMDASVPGTKPYLWVRAPRKLDSDASCSNSIRWYGSDFKLEGEDNIAGIDVVKWTRGNWWSGQQQELNLAPSLGCECLKTHKVTRNRWLVPRITDTTEAVSVELGQPDPALSNVPRVRNGLILIRR